MNRKTFFKLVGFCALLLLATFGQPLLRELNSEVAQLQNGATSLSAQLLPTVPSPLPTPLTVPSLETNVLGASSSAELFTVTKVVDGDTIKVDLHGKVETIRIIGIDTPEVVDPRKPVQCFGKEASEHSKQILASQKVSLVADPSQGDRDKYQRLLRYVFLENGTDFGLSLLKDGYAQEYLYDEPYVYRDQYVSAQKEAETAKRGLWADESCAVKRTP